MPSFEASIDLTSLDGDIGFRISNSALGLLGRGVSAAGDFNGDGIADFLVGAPAMTVGGQSNAGAVYLVYGRTSGFPTDLDISTLTPTEGFRLTEALPQSFAGWSVGAAGDVNGDGLDDIVIGAITDDEAATNAGAAFIVFGTAGTFASGFDLGGLDGTNGLKLLGQAAQDTAGRWVSSAGDINGDGFDDVLIGADSSDVGASSGGSVYLVFGRASGFPATLALSSLDGTDGFRFSGVVSDQAGRAQAGIGDVNGDGVDDLAIGVRDADRPGMVGAGKTFVLFGHTGAFDATYETADFDGSIGFTVQGAVAQHYVGTSVSAAGDVNGDGFDDFVVGAFGNTANGAFAGGAYVIFGTDSGFPATLTVSDLNGGNGFEIRGAFSTDVAGRAVAAGDLNGDGFSDLVVGAPGADNITADNGAAYVVFGRASFGAVVELLFLDGTDGFRANGEASTDRAGDVLGIAGDVNGDGVVDLIIGAYENEGDGPGYGAAYILFGRQIELTRIGTAADETLNGAGADDILSGLGGKDVLNGFAADDQIDGGDGNDQLFGGAGLDDLVGGVGNDVLDGGEGDDSLSDSGGANKLYGGGGDDALTGGANADRMDGGADDDTLIGGAGNDYLDGGVGTNSLTGGTGNDIFIVRSGADSVNENAAEGTDTVRSMISYTLGADLEVLELLTGTDIDGTGNTLANTLKGNNGDNVLSGLDGVDRLDGGAGGDVLIGGTGRDQLTGGAGADSFRVLQESLGHGVIEIDKVLDYEVGVDILDFSLIDADADGGNGDTAFEVVGAFTREAGQLFMFYAAGQDVTTIRLDQNGDGRADYQLTINGNVTADADDWLL